MEIMKICKKCNQSKSLNQFRTRIKDGKSYRRGTCRACEYLESKKYFQQPGVRKRIVDKQRSKDPIRFWITSRKNCWKGSLTTQYLIDLWNKQEGKCYYTGEVLIPEGGRGTNKPAQNSASLDKLNPELGYIEGNVAWCSFRLNTMKGNATEEQFFATLQVILDHRLG